MDARPNELLHRLRTAGPSTAQELQRALGLNRSTFFRLVQKTGPELIRYGRTRAARYAVTRSIADLGSRLPLFRVLPEGGIESLATVVPLWGGGTLVQWVGGRVTEHPGVPWFLDDVRPQGFLGRAFVMQHADLGIRKLDELTADDTLRALALRGEDVPGNLLLGDASLKRFYERVASADARGEAFGLERRRETYPGLARRALQGEIVGSSAAGEQPKFGATLASQGGLRHVLVKFSPPIDTGPGLRWADLLACEHLALTCLREVGLPAAQSELLEAEGYAFLEVTRFDRVLGLGRLPLASLGVVDAEFIGAGSAHWAAAARVLSNQKRLSPKDAEDVGRLEAFGRLIHNTDRHAGNLSLFWRPDFTFSLAPIYDMVPMAFAPLGGHVVERTLVTPSPDETLLAVWEEMVRLGITYWQRVLDFPSVSSAFKQGPAAEALKTAQSLSRRGTS